MKFWQSVETEKNRRTTTSLIIVGLIFFAFVPYAGVDVWTQAVIVALIFALSAISILRGQIIAEREIKLILAPFLILATYCFVQGLATLPVLNGKIQPSAALPYSFDATASFWCAFKFLAFAGFVRLLNINFRRNIRFLVWSLIAVGSFFAVFGIFRFLAQAASPEFFGAFLLPQLRPGIGFGTFINQNHFAFLMLMTFGLNLSLVKCGGLDKKSRLLLFAFCLLSWTAIVLTASRGGIISSFVEIAVLILLPSGGAITNVSPRAGENRAAKRLSLVKRLSGFAIIVIPLIVGIVLIGQDRVVHRFEEIPSQLGGTTSSGTFRRIDIWKATLAMIEEYPLYGSGFGGFRVGVSQHIDISGELTPKEAHNDYLEFIAAGGAVGAICGIWFLYGFFSTLKKRFAEDSDKFALAARVGAVCALSGIAVHNFFDFGLQLIANWLFFAAIISIAVYKQSDDKKKTNAEKASKGNLSFGKLIGAILLICLSVSSVFFGASRLKNFLEKNDANRDFQQSDFLKVPFDADFYETKATINNKFGNYDDAAENFKNAINYRPQDYLLWLELGKIQQAENQNEDAENSFRQAIRLAPLYGEPHFYYGNFLVRSNRRTEGFAELNIAFHRNPRYFEETAAAAWQETGGNAEETFKLLSPLDALDREQFVAFLFAKNSFAALTTLVCREEDLIPEARAGLVIKLFEKKQFFYARQVYRRSCESTNNNPESELVDGDFEISELYKGSGFGWRVGDLPASVKIVSDKEMFLSGSSSLEFIFSGNVEPGLPLISQIVVVEKNHQYHLSYAYQTKEIVTGGLPVLQLILRKQNGTEAAPKEIILTPSNDGWVKNSVMIQTDNQTEAMEIRLARQSCGQSACPIFGRLWLDAFELK